MKKIVFTTALALAVSLSANAQLKVWSGGKVYVGGTATQPNSLLSVGGTGNSLYTGYFYNPNTVSNSANGIRGEAAAPTTGGITTYSIYGVSVPNTVGTGIGVAGSSYRSSFVTGAFAFGVYGQAGNASSGFNYGVWGRLLGTVNGAGVYGTDLGNTASNVAGNYAGYFAGNLRTTDDSPEKPNGGSWVTASDKRIKKDTSNFTDGLAVIRKIRPVNYTYNGIGGFSTSIKSIGVIAQEVQQVAPYCIGKTKIVIKDSEKSNFLNDLIGTAMHDSTGEDKYIAEVLNYNQDGLFYCMLNSIKEMDSTITDLKNEIAVLKGGGQKTGSNNSGSGKGESIYQIELASLPLGEGQGGVILYQNEPNPFNNSTIIRYFVPETISGSIFIGFYDMYGKEIKKLEIKEKGSGKIEAATENLASGIYSYSIIINDKVVETKKMLKNK